MTLRIRNWDRWQSYRKDRGQPPWIKIHRQLMRDQNWVALTDAQRGQLVAIWMLAADRGGVIPASAAMVRKLCFMDSDPDLNLFIEKEFLERRHDDANMASERRHDDQPEKRRGEEIREEEIREEKNIPADAGVDENVARETSQPSLAESPRGLTTKYAFESGVIKLNEQNFSEWQKAFSYLDLPAELISLAEWAGRQPQWFPAVSGALAKRNREQKNKVTAAKENPHKWRSGIEGVV